MSADELLEYTKRGTEDSVAVQLVDKIEKTMEDFFWKLNDNKHYEKESYGGDKEHGFHASALADAECARRLVYDWLKVPLPDGNEIDPKLRRIFDTGHSLHDRWQRYLTILQTTMPEHNIVLIGDWKCKGCGFLLSPNKEIPYPTAKVMKRLQLKGVHWPTNIKDDEPIECPKCESCARWRYNEFKLRKKSLRIVGKRDGKIMLDGHKLLWEIKSINTFQFKSLHVPLAKHIKQFCFYMLMDGTKEGLFLYEDKNNQGNKWFYFKYSSELIKNELQLLDYANASIDAETLPEPMAGFPTCDYCKLCGHKKVCKGDQTYKELEEIFF